MIKQLRKADEVYDKRTMRYQTAQDLAIRLARSIHAIDCKSHGVLNDGMYSVPGLSRLANAYLRSLPSDGYNGATLVEHQLDDTTSHYYPSWRSVKRSSLYDNTLPIVRDISAEACMARG